MILKINQKKTIELIEHYEKLKDLDTTKSNENIIQLKNRKKYSNIINLKEKKKYIKKPFKKKRIYKKAK